MRFGAALALAVGLVAAMLPASGQIFPFSPTAPRPPSDSGSGFPGTFSPVSRGDVRHARLGLEALCTACEAHEGALKDATARWNALETLRIEMLTARQALSEELGNLRYRREYAQAQVDKARKLLEDRRTSPRDRTEARQDLKYAEDGMRGIPERMIAVQAELDALNARLVTVEARTAAASDAVAVASAALRACNERLCRDAIEAELELVVNQILNNPFDPANPLKGRNPGQPPTPPPAGPAGSLQFASPSYSGGEGGAVLIVVTRSGGTSGAVTVGYATSPGSASASDFAAAAGTLTWPAGDATPKSFSIALTDDTQVESTESFTVTLSGPTGGATLGPPSTTTVSIADNDSTAPPQPAGAIQFSTSSFTVAENAGSVTVTATRTGGSAGEVTAQYFTGPSSAVAGSDYQAVSGVLTWGVGDTGAKSFNVPIINDTLVEGPETFFVTLNNPTGGATLGAPATATVTINDDDVNMGPCGATGNAWTPNAGQYACSGSCNPNPSPRLSINGDLVTATQFASGGTATFQGCGSSLNSRETNLTYFGQSNHRATITRSSNTNFNANIVSSGGGTCAFSCTRTGP